MAVSSPPRRFRTDSVGSRWTPPISPGSPWENDFNKFFNGKIRDELLNGGIFYSLKAPQVPIERWSCQYNTVHPLSALGYRPLALEAVLPSTAQ